MILDQIKQDEGSVKEKDRHIPYKDSLGLLTVGYGRLMSRGFSEDEVLLMLHNDLRDTVNDINNNFSWFNSLSEKRQDVIINMVFNLGITKFSKFKNAINHIKRGEWKEASMEMLNSKWARQVGNRAIRLAKEMEEG